MKIIVTESQIKSIHSKMGDIDEDLFLKKDTETKKLKRPCVAQYLGYPDSQHPFLGVCEEIKTA